MNILVVVDMQNDFIDGALGTKETVAIVPNVMEKIKTFHGKVVATRDTHEENYLETQEGRKLPVKHCIRNTEGWEIDEKIQNLLSETPIDKETFGSRDLPTVLQKYDAEEKIEYNINRSLYGHLCDFKCNGIENLFSGSSDYCRCLLLRGSDTGKPQTGVGGDESLSDRNRR